MRIFVATACWLVMLAGAHPAAAQVTAKIDSDGSEMVATVWTPEAECSATILLLPGWGGGPGDSLGIAEALSGEGIGVVTLSPRGWHESEGTSTFANALEDIAAALAWLREPENTTQFGLHPTNILLGGHSWGGGMALAYAARDPSVRRVFSVAGNDHGAFIRHYQADAEFAAMMDRGLASSVAPDGPIRFDVADSLRELAEGQDIYGLLETTSLLADRSILLFGGLEDPGVTVDDMLLPLYRALRRDGAEDITFLIYQSGHSFGTVRDRLHRDLLEWVRR